jgi:hypothetical protein
MSLSKVVCLFDVDLLLSMMVWLWVCECWELASHSLFVIVAEFCRQSWYCESLGVVLFGQFSVGLCSFVGVKSFLCWCWCWCCVDFCLLMKLLIVVWFVFLFVLGSGGG